MLYCDHLEGRGERIFRLACKRDLEGIVAKRKFDPYLPDNAKWYKIRNRKYSQWSGREKLFERGVLPTLTGTIGMLVLWSPTKQFKGLMARLRCSA